MKIRGQWGFSHTTLSRTMFHTPLCHRRKLCHTTFPSKLCHTPSFTQFCHRHTTFHTQLCHTIFHTQLCHKQFFAHQFHTNNSLYHTQLFGCNFQGYGSSTISFVHSCRFNFCFCLLEDVGLWCYPVPYCRIGMIVCKR